MIFFRADGNSKIGAGHIMRCLSIANSAIELGEEVLFYTASCDFRDKIINNGITNIVIDSDFEKMEKELSFFESEIREKKPKLVVIDSYFVTQNYLKRLYEACHLIGGKLAYIDDVVAFAYICDYLINYNIFAENYQERYEKMYCCAGVNLPTFLLGIRYVPLRKEFINLEDRKVRYRTTDVLISTGGADTEHIALSLAKYIDEKYIGNMKFHIVIGAMSRDKEKIEAIASNNAAIITYFDVRDMAALMQSCDIAISAAGSTLYELCATQTPTITYVVANNQILAAEEFSARGLMEYAGDVRKLGLQKLIEEIVDKINKMHLFEYRNERTKRLKTICKNGANNIIAHCVTE